MLVGIQATERGVGSYVQGVRVVRRAKDVTRCQRVGVGQARYRARMDGAVIDVARGTRVHGHGQGRQPVFEQGCRDADIQTPVGVVRSVGVEAPGGVGRGLLHLSRGLARGNFAVAQIADTVRLSRRLRVVDVVDHRRPSGSKETAGRCRARDWARCVRVRDGAPGRVADQASDLAGSSDGRRRVGRCDAARTLGAHKSAYGRRASDAVSSV